MAGLIRNTLIVSVSDALPLSEAGTHDFLALYASDIGISLYSSATNERNLNAHTERTSRSP